MFATASFLAVRWWCGGGAVVVRWWCGGAAVRRCDGATARRWRCDQPYANLH